MIGDMLDLAGDLANRSGGTGRPRSVDLRRAVSTAYYALFHALARLCAVQLVGWSKPWQVIAPIYRSLDHRRARDVLGTYRRQEPSSALASVAAAFDVLQDARHRADYDPEPFRLNRGATLDLIATARQAVAVLETLAPDQKLTLAVRLITRQR